jgi:hypothetical protein
LEPRERETIAATVEARKCIWGKWDRSERALNWKLEW